MTDPKRSMWARARHMAEQAPPERNRYVDFLRALSILAVVIGHWLVSAPYMQDGAIEGGHLLGLIPWTQWLTLGFQVMPIFFLVGGFSNGTSWAATQRKACPEPGRRSGHYADWFGGRVMRLLNPVLPLFLIWTVFAAFGTQMGVERRIVSMAAQLALVPVWFLSVYLIVSALVPLSWSLWQRFGLASFWGFVAGAVLIDGLSLRFNVPYINFLNFLFVWCAIHQLGYAWNAGHFSPGKAVLWGTGGAVALALLIGLGPYPVAMIGVPGANLSNSMPPTLALLALGVAQAGIALALEPAGRRMLENIRVWTATVLLNGMIMSVYLWHLTAFVFVMVAAWLMGGIGLHAVPGSSSWWLTRPIWFGLYIAMLLPLIALFARFEQPKALPQRPAPIPHWRLLLGLVLVCAGLGFTAAISIASPEGVTGVRLWLVALPFVGAALIGFGPVRDMARRVSGT
jgi:peptidoglycan/LPS O-acetylase OafA/YrhL